MASIFLSHNHADKPFARRIANDLINLGAQVWIDEAEIKIGDSLIEKIREGIDNVDYVGVIISYNSIKSEWVKKEVDIAMNQEIEGKQVKVLPLLTDTCPLPGFLKGKLYADFRYPKNYVSELFKVAARLGINRDSNYEKTAKKLEKFSIIESVDSKIEGLIKTMLQDEDGRVRGTAATALGKIGDRIAVEGLCHALLNDFENNVRGSAAYALGIIRDKSSVPALIKALIYDENAAVRGTAAIALGKIGDRTALESLHQALEKDTSGNVRGSAAQAIGFIQTR